MAAGRWGRTRRARRPTRASSCGTSRPPHRGTVDRWAGTPPIAKRSQLQRLRFKGRTPMPDAVLRPPEGRIGILPVNNPPVNALAAAVRNGIKEGVEAFGQDPNVDAIVLIGGGRTFSAGPANPTFG